MVDGSLAILADAIRRQRKIEWLHVQHEETAAFAAGAEARLTGELAVCAELRARQPPLITASRHGAMEYSRSRC